MTAGDVAAASGKTRLAQADKLATTFAKSDPDAEPGSDGYVSVDLRSMSASYQRQRDRGTKRAQLAYAHGLLRRARADGHKIPAASSSGSSSGRKTAASRGSTGGSGTSSAGTGAAAGAGTGGGSGTGKG